MSSKWNTTPDFRLGHQYEGSLVQKITGTNPNVAIGMLVLDSQLSTTSVKDQRSVVQCEADVWIFEHVKCRC